MLRSEEFWVKTGSESPRKCGGRAVRFESRGTSFSIGPLSRPFRQRGRWSATFPIVDAAFANPIGRNSAPYPPQSRLLNKDFLRGRPALSIRSGHEHYLGRRNDHPLPRVPQAARTSP